MTFQGENEIRAQRMANLEALRAAGFEPWGGAFARTGSLAEIRTAFEEGRAVALAGRVLTTRDMGKSVFAHLTDGSDRFQVYARGNILGEEHLAAFKRLDLGDIIGAEGTLFTTRTGEKTLQISRWVLLAKALRPLPEKWHGLRDVEARYRQRYLDLIANPEVRARFDQRSRAVREIRNYLCERGFLEVETPMIQPQAGGAAARPFVTRYEALNTDMYLRIAPELYLKRLLVGGFDKVFELNRNFRNEGLSRSHNPEFTMLEVYEAYADMRAMKTLAEGLITHLASTVFGRLVVGEGDNRVDLTPPWREITYRELVRDAVGPDWFDLPMAEARRRAAALGLTVPEEWAFWQITHEVYEKLIERTLRDPTFVTRLPAELVPLAKRCPDDPSVVDVFELVIGGREIAPGYSELNDPLEQRKRFEEQAGEDVQKVDEEFLEAMEHGMPPAGGMGIGVDRLLMILTGVDAIRDVILFPQLKPRERAGGRVDGEEEMAAT